MYYQVFILILLSFLFSFTIFHITNVLSANDDDSFFSISPEDYYNLEEYGEEPETSTQVSEENNSSDQNTLSTSLSPPLTTTTNKTVNTNSFNIAVTADWGCEEDTKNTVQNIQNKNPELVIAAGDLSYSESSECWFDIIEPLKSKMKITMGDHEYRDTIGGITGVINQYLKPLNLQKTYYSFDMNNVHVTIIDPFIDYGSPSAQYRFID